VPIPAEEIPRDKDTFYMPLSLLGKRLFLWKKLGVKSIPLGGIMHETI
jgi:hypothetical protein